MGISEKTRNLNVDVLKAFAILAVVLYHLGSGILPFGYLGVDIFFVISGFFIMSAMDREYAAGEKHRYWKTLFSRIKRLWLPVLTACMISLVIGFFVMLPDDFENLCQSIVASGVFLNNVLACITTKNYWDVANVYKPLMHLWYVGVLMQAYVVLPVLLTGVFRFGKTRKQQGFAVGLLLVLSFLIYILPIGTTAEKFYYLPFRLFEFFAGAIAAVAAGSEWRFAGTKNTVLTGVLGVILVILIGTRDVLISQQLMLVATVICSGLLMVMFAKGQPWRGPMTRAVGAVGKASFSIYLWHQPLIAFMYYCLVSKLTVWSAIVFAVACAGLSLISYRFLEQPLQRAAPKLQKRILFGSTVLCVILCAIGFLGYLNGGVVRDVPELGITKADAQRGLHARYNDRVYTWNTDFEDDDTVKVLVIGDSFGRDFANILSESSYAEKLQISYIYPSNEEQHMQKYANRISEADVVFYAPSGNFDDLPEWLTGATTYDRVYVVGIKNYGKTNGYIYSRRHTSGYLEMAVEIDESLWQRNEKQKEQYGGHYIDMLEPVTDENGHIRVFTDDGKMISQDCQHLTMYGAKFYATVLELSWILNFA